MVMSSTAKQLSPGEIWLELPSPEQSTFLKGLIEGLNQGLRHCAQEVSFGLATRLSGNLQADDNLALGSLTQQMRTWSKANINVFKYSKPLQFYADALSEFYEEYPKYHNLAPAYLMIYM